MFPLTLATFWVSKDRGCKDEWKQTSILERFRFHFPLILQLLFSQRCSPTHDLWPWRSAARVTGKKTCAEHLTDKAACFYPIIICLLDTWDVKCQSHQKILTMNTVTETERVFHNRGCDFAVVKWMNSGLFKETLLLLLTQNHNH